MFPFGYAFGWENREWLRAHGRHNALSNESKTPDGIQDRTLQYKISDLSNSQVLEHEKELGSRVVDVVQRNAWHTSLAFKGIQISIYDSVGALRIFSLSFEGARKCMRDS
jgi:hypothetical protein